MVHPVVMLVVLVVVVVVVVVAAVVERTAATHSSDKSNVPTNNISTPGTIAISSQFSSPSTVSIMGIASVVASCAAWTKPTCGI